MVDVLFGAFVVDKRKSYPIRERSLGINMNVPACRERKPAVAAEERPSHHLSNAAGQD